MRNHLCLFLIFISITLFGQRQEISFNNDWKFEGTSRGGLSYEKNVDLPHTWNDKDAQAGITQHRTKGIYSKTFFGDTDWSKKRVFIHFEGANITTKVLLNGQEVGKHKGGYAAFSFELTPLLKLGQDNHLKVEVSNEMDMAVIPLVGDFNNYGGIYRPVRLIVTEQPLCISPLDYASPGIYIKPASVSKESAEIEVMTKYLSKDKALISYRTTVLDAEGKTVLTKTTEEAISMNKNGAFSHTYTIQEPHLWNGKQDPYMYQVRVELIKDGQVLDSKTENFGLRYFDISASNGFSLNGASLPLRGVSRHQDKIDKGSALLDSDHELDMDLMLEMGINTLRLAHYQHAEKVYDLADSAGVVVWAEIPFIGLPEIAITTTNGYEPNDEFHANTKQQLIELIRQNYNHPSIVMWSLYNELQNPEDASPVEFLKELNNISKTEDPSRLTVAAGLLSPDKHPEMQNITDVFAYNRYYGWYYDAPSAMADFLDETHANFPNHKIGISEYGAGGSIHQHSEDLERPNPVGTPHPEEWQSYYHEQHLQILDDRPFVWGSFVWNMFDFSAHGRREGDQHGRNDKGLVTFDRKTKKDAFYYYKANWSDEPVLHITSRRHIFRKKQTVDIKAYSNLSEVKLHVNGKDYPVQSPEKGIAMWKDINLKESANSIFIQSSQNDKIYTDEVVWMYEPPYKGRDLIIRIYDWLPSAHYWIGGGVLVSLLTLFFCIRKLKNRSIRIRVLGWLLFVFFILVTIGIYVMKIFFEGALKG